MLLMLLIVAGSLIDTLNGKPVVNHVIEIRGERMISVSNDLPAPPEATVIDLGDATVLPGLLGPHTHLTYAVTDRIGL